MRRVTRPTEVYRAYAEGEGPEATAAGEAPPTQHDPGADWSEPAYGQAVTGRHSRLSRLGLTALACLAGLAAGFGAVTVIERLLDAPARGSAESAAVAGSLGGPSARRVVGSTAEQPSYKAGTTYSTERAPASRELRSSRTPGDLQSASPGSGSVGEPVRPDEDGGAGWPSQVPVGAVGLTVGEAAADSAGDLEAEFGFEH